jgi:hypothetical protein
MKAALGILFHNRTSVRSLWHHILGTMVTSWEMFIDPVILSAPYKKLSSIFPAWISFS